MNVYVKSNSKLAGTIYENLKRRDKPADFIKKDAHFENDNIPGQYTAKDILIRSDKMQQYAGIYLLQNHSTCFRCLSHPSSGEHKTVTAASDTGHITKECNNLPPTWPLATMEEGCCSDTMTCTRGCSYSFMFS